MEMNAHTPQGLLDQAAELESKARRSTRFLVTYFTVWALASIVLGVVLFFHDLVGHRFYMAGALIGWAIFIIGWLFFYYAGRSTRPRATGPMWALAVVGGSVPWSLSTLVRPGPDASWWLAGLPWLAAGLICAAFLFAAAHMADRQTR